jgi:polyferredoxin
MKQRRAAGIYPALQKGRALVAVFVLAGFTAGLSLSGLVFDGLLNLLVSMQFVPALLRLLLSGGALAVSALIPMLLVSALPLVLGRVYCSVLCPLGILQDLMLFLSRRISRGKLRSLLEPYAFWGRIHRDVFVPITAFGSSGFVEALKSFEIYLAPVSACGSA